MASLLVVLNCENCAKSPNSERPQRTFRSIDHECTFGSFARENHSSGAACIELSASDNGPWTRVESDMVAGSLFSSFPDLKYIRLKCQVPETTTVLPSTSVRSAFEIMMSQAAEKCTPSHKTRCGALTRKDELYNDVADLFAQKNWFFSKTTVESEGSYIVQVLCNALWYITNQHEVIENASKHKEDVIPVPRMFDKFQGYNEIKRKRLKEAPMQAMQLKSHSDALYSLCVKPIMKSTPEWSEACSQIQALADCFNKYRINLEKQCETQNKIHKLDHPVRQVSVDCTVEHRHKARLGVKEEYGILNASIIAAAPLQPVFFDESKHLISPFQNNMQRFRFIEHLQLSMPVHLYKYCPGGSHVTVVCIVKVEEGMNESEQLTQSARTMADIKNQLPEFHTRCMKREFKSRMANLADVSPSVLDLIYKELTMDSATAQHPETQQRLRLIFLGNTGLLADLRKLNTGRPTGTFDTFFSCLGQIIEEVSAADERRHNIAHMSEWLSIKDLMKRAADLCPENTPIPSQALVRLQFTPRNPYIHAALNFTSRFDVQFKIQRRQLRVFHPDDHYCAALLKYLKHLTVNLRDSAMLLCCDDKAKIHVGEPGSVLSTGVRGKKTLAPTQTTLGALDHDVNHKGSLTPSVYLRCDIPPEPTKSFVRGSVTTVINDSVFQVSSAFRHASSVVQLIRNEPQVPAILLKFSDGGTDQRNTLESVKCSLICIFKELNLDMLIAARCAPGQSWTNPAERIMSILNIGLQNCSLERQAGDDTLENRLKSCHSMDDVRKLAERIPEVKDAWISCMQPCIKTIENRFSRLSLKENPVQVSSPVKEAEIQLIQSHLTSLFPDLDLTKLTKVFTRRCTSYQNWLDIHCRQRQYMFQIRKCDNSACCGTIQSANENLMWLPDPQLDPNNAGHYLPFHKVYGFETTESDRPSALQAEKLQACKLKVKKASQSTKLPVNETKLLLSDETLFADTSVFTAQNAQVICECVECRKPRVIYSKNKLTERQKMQMALLMSEYEYSCGAPATPPGHGLHGHVFARLNITCENIIEVPYYSAAIGRRDLCCYCGIGDTESNRDLKKKFKTVLPVCSACNSAKLETPCFRPYGKAD